MGKEVVATTDNGGGAAGSTGSSSASGSGVGSTAGAVQSTAPASAQAALEKAASAASGASSAQQTGAGGSGAAGTGSATEGATSTSAGTGTAAGTSGHSSQQGAIPYDRHQTALANARKEYEWVGQLGPRENISEAVRWHQSLRQNPRAFLQQLASELAEQGAFEDDAELVDPEPVLRSEDGKYSTYDDKGLKTMFHNMEQRMMRLFKPFGTFMEGTQREAKERKLISDGIAASEAAYKYASGLKYFKDNEAEIGNRLAAMDKNYRRSIGTRAALLECYHAVLDEKVYPGLDTAAEERVRARMREKANGGGAGNVGAGGATDQKPQLRDGDIDGLAAHMERVNSRLSQQTA